MQMLFYLLLIMLTSSLYEGTAGARGSVPAGGHRETVPADFKPFMDKEGCRNCTIVAANGTQTLYCDCNSKGNKLKQSQLKLNGCMSKHKIKNLEDLKDKIHNRDGQLVCGD